MKSSLTSPRCSSVELRTNINTNWHAHANTLMMCLTLTINWQCGERKPYNFCNFIELSVGFCFFLVKCWEKTSSSGNNVIALSIYLIGHFTRKKELIHLIGKCKNGTLFVTTLSYNFYRLLRRTSSIPLGSHALILKRSSNLHNWIYLQIICY